jgi:serine phosphatase RsbU (regulator of sigma subunit)
MLNYPVNFIGSNYHDILNTDDDIAEFISHISMELQPGNGIVLYTNGIPEVKDINKKQYGVEQMWKVLAKTDICQHKKLSKG